MKITGIKFLNLNSLKGRHELRFDQPPFTESGLFAITGQTGAGKTTILDAITVALYGRVHRHDKEASESMTRFTAESSAEIEFEVNNRFYRSKWSIRRSHNKFDGALQTARMELADALSGEIIIGHPLAAVQNKIVEVCGLDYHQFLRSVMLSQGDFTRFLRANENERSELLERITDTGIYSQISTYVYEKTKEKKAHLETLRSRMNDVVLLSLEEKNAILISLQQLRSESAEFKVIKAGIETKITWLRKVQALEDKRQFHLAELESFKQVAVTHAAEFEKLKRHFRAAVHRAAWQGVGEQQQQRVEIEEKIGALERDQPFLAEEAGLAANAVTVAASAYEKAQETLNLAEPVLATVLVRDTEIEAKKKQLQAAEATLSALQTDVSKARTQKEAKQLELLGLTTKFSALDKWLQENQQDENLVNVLPHYQRLRKDLLVSGQAADNARSAAKKYSAELTEVQAQLHQLAERVASTRKAIIEIRATQAETVARLQQATGDETDELIELKSNALPVLIALCRDQLRLSNEYRRLLEIQQQLQSQIETGKKQYTEAGKELTKLSVEKEQAETLLNDLQQLVELQIRIQKYDADRGQLEPEKPCPLCGSLHHPYVEGQYTSHVNQAVEQRNKHKRSLDILLKTYNTKSLDANTLITSIGALTTELAQTEAAIGVTSTAFSKNNEALPKSLMIGDSNLINAIVANKEKEHIKLQQQLAAIRTLQKETANLESRLHISQQELSKSDGAVMQMEERTRAVKRELIRVQADVETHTMEAAKFKNEATFLLSPYSIDFDPAFAGEIETRLHDRLSHYSRCIRDFQSLKVEIGSNEAQSISLQMVYSDVVSRQQKQELLVENDRLSLQELQAERRILFGEKDPGQERKRLSARVQDAKLLVERSRDELQMKQQAAKVNEEKIEEWKRQLQSVNEKYDSLLRDLTTKLASAGIEPIEVLQTMLISAEEEQRLSQLQNETERHISTTAGILKTVEEEYLAEVERQLATESEEELSKRQIETEERISVSTQKVGALQQRLEADAQTELKYKEVAAQVQIQKVECLRWDKIAQLIGSADGRKFSKFAQGLTLARLTELANRHLRQLTDRYLVIKSPGKDLELQIIDGYQADVVRPVTTLSGGESFLVSLSLALGLSDLAGSKTQINSLFIDEGFGTLDAETLDVAISALENLQASGKMIGIISHVEALKERIGTQVEVSKQPGGYSRIRVKSYGREYL